MSKGKSIVSASFNYETLEETLDVKPGNQPLVIGLPKETDFQENRISLTPDAVSVLLNYGLNDIFEDNIEYYNCPAGSGLSVRCIKD